MSEPLNPNAIGLFGTCDKSKWREPFMQLFAEHKVPFFNPMVDNWTPELAEVEAWHLANDKLILFPVTSESYGFGSLAETGFSINSALTLNKGRFVLMYIAPDVDDALKQEDPVRAKASRTARALAIAHLAHVANPNVIVVKSMREMLDKVLALYAAVELLERVRGPENTWRQAMPVDTWLQLILSKSQETVTQPQNVLV